MKKVTKNTVKAIIKKQGEIRVALIPCKICPENILVIPTWIVINSLEELEKVINTYSYYNCNSELGNYLHFYI